MLPLLPAPHIPQRRLAHTNFVPSSAGKTLGGSLKNRFWYGEAPGETPKSEALNPKSAELSLRLVASAEHSEHAVFRRAPGGRARAGGGEQSGKRCFCPLGRRLRAWGRRGLTSWVLGFNFDLHFYLACWVYRVFIISRTSGNRFMSKEAASGV